MESLTVIIFLCFVSVVAADWKCEALGGNCQDMFESYCSGSYRRNKCSGSYSRRCCVSSSNADSRCEALGGNCQDTFESYCSGSYRRNLCGGSYRRRCCISSSSGSCSGSSAACRILELHNSGDITLQNSHPSLEVDEAFPLLNIRDACNGRKSKRSSYRCSECRSRPAPGGSVCIDNRILSYIEAIAELHSVTITSITGACHSCTSKHYRGRAVDVRRNGPYSSYVTKCDELGGRGIDEGTHIHCQFN